MIDPHLGRVRCATAAVIMACLAILGILGVIDVRSDDGAQTYGFNAPALPTYVTSASADPSTP